MAFGTLTVKDTLQSLKVAAGTVIQFGEDRVWEAISALSTAHNRITAELIETFAEVSTTRYGRVGNTDSTNMEEITEHGTAQPQKVTSGAFQGWPLKKYGNALQWTADYFRNAQVSEIAIQFTAAITADMRLIQRLIKSALYLSANYTFIDVLVDAATLPVKALQNADSFPIPPGPNGELFNSATHTHYIGCTAAWSGASVAQKTADATALVNTILEHYNEGEVQIVVNTAQVADMLLLTGFVAYNDQRIIKAITADRTDFKFLNMTNIYNRAIGLFNGAEVWVKPWAIAGRIAAYITNQEKPLRIRVRGTGIEQNEGKPTGILGNSSDPSSQTGNGDLQFVAEFDQYPLRCKQYRRELGVAARNRLSAACLDVVNTTYTDPVIT